MFAVSTGLSALILDEWVSSSMFVVAAEEMVLGMLRDFDLYFNIDRSLFGLCSKSFPKEMKKFFPTFYEHMFNCCT